MDNIDIISFCSELNIDSSNIIKTDNSILLKAGGQQESFDITDSNIDLCKLNQGLGREFFPALYDPRYEPSNSFHYHDQMPCLILKDDGEIKVFPYSLLSQHETINEKVGDEHVMVVFCELADLAAVYTREYCGQVFTFAPSGYTYQHPDYWNGVQGILLWDRETESLWWPLSDVCLSGKLKDTQIKKAPFQIWELMKWGEALEKYPNSISLSHDQPTDPPQNLSQYSDGDLGCE